MAKRASKRVSERRKTKTAITNARKEAKLRRELNKKQRKTIKVPKSFLMTDEEKEHLRSIKKAAQLRASEAELNKSNDPEHISKLKQTIAEKQCDCFIEVVDFRDIDGSRVRDCEKLMADEGVSFFTFINFYDNSFEIDITQLAAEGHRLVESFEQFKNFKKICIFGHPKVGKFFLSKNINDVNSEIEFEFIRVPTKSKGLSEVLRKIVDIKELNSSAMFAKIFSNLDKEGAKEFFRLARFSDANEFLQLLADKLSKERNMPVSPNDAALFFFENAKNGQIRWAFVSKQISFKF